MMKSFPAELDSLYEMLEFIRAQAQIAGFNSCYLNKIELATEEVLVNIINYGYPAGKGNILISCSFNQNLGIEIKIQDEGIPYNPLKVSKNCDCKAPLDERTVGGYGIFFVLNLMDEVHYARERNLNILTLKKFH
ncbi:Uncharacterized protein PHSC3_001952 [Chlamydiales bacterium STE3]|nr:Uncharacterized protein PHSC3_001952 [Chlamydiales bacterium STE3]